MGATYSQQSMDYLETFQFTPPRGGDVMVYQMPVPSRNFNSRPRVGATDVGILFQRTADISIHAPAWGRRSCGFPLRCAQTISIHAPAWGRRIYNTTKGEKKIFQFTPPRGGDPNDKSHTGQRTAYFNSRPRVGATRDRSAVLERPDISIHAPAWGRPRL